jgi:type VI secretion system protein ImpL
MLKYIFAAVFIALSWALVLVFRDVLPMWPAVVATAVIGGGLLVYIAVRAVLAKRSAAAIESGLSEQAAGVAGAVRPDQQAEIAAMQTEFTRAVQTLKSSKLGRSGRDALGLLPWYVMIGPSASGKTTAIRNSGIKLPLGKSGKVRGVGGTRNCDWWMTNEAILLDTAGRWSTDDDDREEWLAFLDLLKRTRPRRPINGVLVAIGATDLTGDVEEIGELARTLRERIDELTGRLDMVVPVYLMVTKCDLVSGFVETFGDLKDRERGQIWGFTLPVAGEYDDHVDAFAQNFDDLAEVLERYSLARMAEERRVEARDRIYAFPRQFDSLRQGLIDLIASLFDRSVYEDAPVMRGVYFTSGTQEGRPVDRIMASMAEAFGVRPQALSPPVTKPKSYFVRDMFQRVVFPDAGVAVESTRALKRQRLLRIAVAAGALVAAVCFLGFPISSYLKNRSLIEEADRFVDRLRPSPNDRGRGLAAPALEAVDPTAAQLATLALRGPEISHQFGLYPGSSLLDPVRMAVERLVVVPLLQADAGRLMEFARGERTIDETAAESGLLLDLLLTQPKAADEPAPENEHWRDKWVDVVATQMGQQWSSLAGDDTSTRARRAIENIGRFYAVMATSSGDLVARKSQVISRTRSALLSAHEGDPLVDLLRDPALPADVRLVDVVGGAVTLFDPVSNGPGTRPSGPSVPGAFTPAGWKVVEERIERLTNDREHDANAWVLAAPRVRQDADAGSLRSEYFRRYVDTWKTFLLALSIREPSNINDARVLLKTLLTQKPLDAVWRNAGKELIFRSDEPATTLAARGKAQLARRLGDAKKKLLPGDEAQPEDAANPSTDKNDGRIASDGKEAKEADDLTTPEDVGREFSVFLGFGLTKPTGLDAYGQLLGELTAVLGEPGAPAPDPGTFQTALKAARSKLDGLIANYNDHNWEGGLLAKMLMPPLSGSEAAVGGATADSANHKWCENVVVVFDQLLAGKYPFYTRHRVREAPIADLDKVFHPKTGVLWQYFSASLQGDFDHPAGTDIFTLKDQPSVKYKPALSMFLKRAQNLTDLLYGQDGSKLGMTVSLRIRASAPYTKIIFESGARKMTYFNTKERWEDFVWPAGGAVFRTFQNAIESQLGYPDGQWALFHLLDDARVAPASDGEEYLAASWTPPGGGPPIHADLKPPAVLRAFRGLEIPRGIVSGTSGCR